MRTRDQILKTFESMGSSPLDTANNMFKSILEVLLDVREQQGQVLQETRITRTDLRNLHQALSQQAPNSTTSSNEQQKRMNSGLSLRGRSLERLSWHF